MIKSIVELDGLNNYNYESLMQGLIKCTELT